MFKAVLVSAVVAAGITCAPVVQADPCNNQACLQQPFSQGGGPYVGSWGAHGEQVTINADGTGVENLRNGTRTFTMDTVSTQDSTAFGHVPGGGYVTVSLVDGGRGMLFSMANGDQSFPFCKIVNGSAVNSADCGA